MKKKIIILLFLVLPIGSMMANPVSPVTARQVAATWMQAMGMQNVKALVDVTAQTPFTEFYLFAAPDSGFILVSGDDCAMPVIGYSVENTFPTKDIPQHVLSFLTAYEEEIRWCRQHPDDIADTVARGWQLLSSGRMPEAAFDHSVLPLMTTCWSQQSPYYNDLCPLYDDTTHSVAGCVAVAMAQIMKYWNYPATGYGSHSYNHFLGTQSADFGATTYHWDRMPYRLTATSSAEEVEEVARLLYHCGVAVDMNYYHNGSTSTASADNALLAMIRYFKYRPDYSKIYRNNFPDSVYYGLVRSELDQGRPLLVCGDYSTGGHAFNCDGYTSFDFFHFNLGWGGLANGYYIPTCIYPDNDDVPFLINNYFYVGIQPDSLWDTTRTSTISASPSGALASITGTGDFSFGTVTSLLVRNVQSGFRFAHWNDYSIQNPREVIATGRDINLVAILEPVAGDTLSYCGNISVSSAYMIDRWGILLPGDLFPYGDTLTAVQIYTIAPGDYTLNIHLGSMNTSPVSTESRHFTNSGFNSAQWHTIPLAVPVPVDSGQNVYICFSGDENAYNATAAVAFSGSSFGGLWGDSLHSFIDQTWMIKGIFSSTSSVGDTTGLDICNVPLHIPYHLGSDSARFTEHARCWSTLDADGDGYCWNTESTWFASKSWSDGSALTPDNWLFSPAIELPDIPCVLSWFEYRQWNYPHEHYGVYISTTGTDTAGFTLLAEYTCDTSDVWIPYELPLDDWLGETVHLAFRHFNCSDQSILYIHNVSVVNFGDKTVDVRADKPAWGSVTGSGSYAYGSNVTVEATPAEGCTFQGWDNGITDNPYILTLTSDTVLTALFCCSNSIDNIEVESVNIHVRDGHIIVEGAEGETVRVYDMEGREASNSQLPTGVYIVKVGNRPAQKIIIIQ